MIPDNRFDELYESLKKDTSNIKIPEDLSRKILTVCDYETRHKQVFRFSPLMGLAAAAVCSVLFFVVGIKYNRRVEMARSIRQSIQVANLIDECISDIRENSRQDVLEEKSADLLREITF